MEFVFLNECESPASRYCLFALHQGVDAARARQIKGTPGVRLSRETFGKFHFQTDRAEVAD